MKGLSELRILAFCDYYSPDSSGGAERVALEVYRRLVEADAHVLLLTTSLTGMHHDYQEDGIWVWAVPALDLRRVTGAQVSVAPRVFRESRRLQESFQPNVLHANSLHFQTSAAAAFLQRRTRVPMVATMQLARPVDLPAVLRVATSTYEQSVGRFIVRSSSAVIAVSEAVSRHAQRLGAPRDRIHLVPNGVDHDRFYPRSRTGAELERPLVLCVGRLISNKGPQVLIEALARPPRSDVDVVFVGDGPMREELERKVEKLGLRDRVRFEGQSHDVADWLRQADVLVRPSFTEGLPLTVLEAMASRVCVVASDIAGNADLLRHGKSGLLFPVGDAGALAAALHRAISDSQERGRLAERGWEASRAYSWDACAEATGDILSNVSERVRPASS
jgi:glycosyltransferase involved in cell wall biosynthesis